ncbi:MAG: hypothetical protein R3C14_53660 [Caldilineaceae bacterium]
MQAKPRIVRLFAVALILSLALGACGGGTTGSTWFNLPSLPVTLQADGAVNVFGMAVSRVDPAMVQQLQSANIQKLEVRIGYNGIHVYANGNDLPYIAWDAASVDTLQQVLHNMPNIPNHDTIANALPWLRQIGTGLAINIGAKAPSTMSWHGETAAQAGQAPAEPTIGPFQLGSVSFDKEGNLKFGNVSGSALGLNGPLLDPNTLNMLASIGMDKLQIKTEPNGIKLSMNDKPLPSIAYDEQSLMQVEPLVAAFAPGLAPTLDNLLPKLPNTALDVAVSFTGEAAGATELGTVPVVINDDGTLTVFGLPLSSTPMLPADLLQKLQQAGVQQMTLEVGQDGLFIAADGQTLPTITWTPESMQTLAGIVAPLAGVQPDMISNGLALIEETGAIKAVIALPGSGGTATPAEINKTLSAPTATDVAPPVIHLNAVYSNGAIQSLGGLTDLPMLPIALPPNVAQILDSLNAKEVKLKTDGGKLNVMLDGNTALTLNYDDPSLQSALNLAGPFLGGTPLDNPAMQQLLENEILPIVPSADLDVKVAVQ